MKIQCDVCDQEEALVFCTADEAALCHNCDNRVHTANKLASKHPRFALIHNHHVKRSPTCDICQERRALVFCQEDRALLCKECDIPIHRVSEHTKNHNRYLLTGIKLSTACCSESSPDPQRANMSANRQGSDSKSSITEYLLDTSQAWQVEDFFNPS